MKIVAVTGGIGSGKSVVSSVLRTLGYQVYDCDIEAKRLMDTDDKIKNFICDKIDCHSIVPQGDITVIDKKRLAEVIFNDSEKLSRLNTIVHTEVRKDIIKRISSFQQKPHGGIFFFETAILRTSGLDSIVDEIWFVDAPADIRLRRLVCRGLSQADASARINTQAADIESFNEHNSKFILNDGLSPIIPKILKLIEKLNDE